VRTRRGAAFPDAANERAFLEGLKICSDTEAHLKCWREKTKERTAPSFQRRR
jgi:hypothetical protein